MREDQRRLRGTTPHRSVLSSLCRSALALVTLVAPASAATTGANGSHDPSRIIKCEGRFYVFSTGGGSKSSTDGLTWTGGPSLFPAGIPTSTTSVVSNNEGVWAPDVIFLNGQYYIYYAVANTSNDCAIGLVTTPTLNPSSSAYKITDHGVVVSDNGSATYCAIDPAPILDASGNLWLSWGSGYTKSASDNTIYLTLLDSTTGLPSSADSAKPGHPVQPGHIEASYVYYHAGNYYLFWNSGGCCDGASSTYEIHVASSPNITGPYSGSRIFYASNGSIHGPGQIGIYDQCGASRFTYHYYPDTGGSVLGENELTWGSDGWPVAGAPSTTPLVACNATGTGGTGGPSIGGTGGTGSGGAGTGGTGGTGSGGAGTGGSGGTGAAGRSGAGTGGASGTGAVGGGTEIGGRGGDRDAGTGGAIATGGTTGGTAGLGGGSSGGSTATGGVSGTGGAGVITGGAGGSESGGSQGCSCAVDGRSDAGLAMPGFALALGLLVAHRAKRRRR